METISQKTRPESIIKANANTIGSYRETKANAELRSPGADDFHTLTTLMGSSPQAQQYVGLQRNVDRSPHVASQMKQHSTLFGGRPLQRQAIDDEELIQGKHRCSNENGENWGNVLQKYALKSGPAEFLKEQEFVKNAYSIQFSKFESCIGIIARKGNLLSGVHLVASEWDDDIGFKSINSEFEDTAQKIIRELGEYDEVILIGEAKYWEDDENTNLFMQKLKQLTNYTIKPYKVGYWNITYSISDGWKIKEKAKEEMDYLWNKYNKPEKYETNLREELARFIVYLGNYVGLKSGQAKSLNRIKKIEKELRDVEKIKSHIT